MNRYIIRKHCYLSVKSQSELTGIYKAMNTDYPKFFKMDNLSKLGFIATEMLLFNYPQCFVEREDVAILGFNRSSSLDTDRHYQTTIQQKDSYFPSPSIFVYTLPNIVIGEIAIKNRICGETCFYIIETLDLTFINHIILNTFQERSINFIIALWVEYTDNSGETYAALIERHNNDMQDS